jgi:NADH-quinone oxidoreductase subunit J
VTTRPELNLGRHLLPGLAAAALFAVIAAVVVGAPFGEPEGLGGANVVAGIGNAMFGLPSDLPGENFLVAFEVIDLVLVGAIVGAVMLARRETDGATVALLTDGGRELRRTLGAAGEGAGDGDGEVEPGTGTDADDGGAG